MIPNMENIEAILFDLDGTLIDTDDLAVERLASLIRPFFRTRSDHIARRFMMRMESPGNWLVGFLDLLGLDEAAVRLTDWLRRKRGIFPPADFRLIPGVEQTVNQLKQRYKLGIVTTRSRYHINQFMAQFPMMAAAFEISIGLQDTHRLKPHPEPILTAVNRLGVPPENCLMAGDTTVDIQAAVGAGAVAVAVLSGFGEREELERAGALLVLESISGLLDIL